MIQLSYTAPVGVALALLVYGIAKTVYNLYLHPLAKYPGPLLHRASRLPYLYKICAMRLSTDMLAYHERYGNVVRVAPNELAFSSHQAWKDIYGYRPGQPNGELPKNPVFYRDPGQAPSIVSEDKENHVILRKLMGVGFSDRSMREQEPIIGSYVSLLVKRLRDNCVDQDETTGVQKKRALDMTSWYTWTTFDIIGDLAFGEPFGCLERSDFHPWVAAISSLLGKSVYIMTAKYLGVYPLVFPIFKWLNQGRNFHNAETAQMLDRRMELKGERHDLIAPLLTIRHQLGDERLRLNAGTLIIGGSETTATLLSGATYLLCANPETLRKVTDEVRSSFKSDEEITLLSVTSLTYMLACLNETLRHYPPVAGGMTRHTPNGEVMVDGHMVPKDTTLSVWQYATYHRSAYFKEPFSFRPERWLNDPAYADDHLDVVRPFSVGPRDCVGKNLSYAEMRLILARVLYNFDMELADKDVDWLDQKAYNLWRKPPLNVYLTPRTV